MELNLNPSSTIQLALTPREAARALGISTRTLWTHTKENRIPHLRIGRRIIYPIDALRDWIKRTIHIGQGDRPNST